MFLAAAILASPKHAGQSSATTLEGKPLDPFAGAPEYVALIFLRSDCPACNQSSPVIAKLAQDFTNKVAFTLVFPRPEEEPAALTQYLKEYQIDFIPVALDPGHALVTRASATTTPQAALFRDGKLVYSGRIDDRWVSLGTSRPTARTHDFEDAITATLAGKPVKEPRTKAIGCAIEE